MLPRWLAALWPQVPLGIALVLSGGVNILDGMREGQGLFHEVAPLSQVATSLSILGSNAQTLLGATLVLVGIGLFWKLRSAWSFAVLLLAITVGVNAARGQWGTGLVLACAILLALFALRRHFVRHTILANYLISLIGVTSVLAYGTIGSYLLGAGFKPPIRDMVTAFYFTIITLSTVGYGDIIPITVESRMFAVSLLVVGLSIFATAVASALGPVISGELERVFGTRKRPMKPTHHVILVGDGAIARDTALELQSRNISFVQVTAPGVDAPFPDQQIVGADPSETEVLDQACIDDATMLIAARDDDGENAFICLAAKEQNPRIKVLAVANSTRSIRRLKLARADVVFAPVAVGSRLLANLVEGGEIPPEFQDLLDVELNRLEPDTPR